MKFGKFVSIAVLAGSADASRIRGSPPRRASEELPQHAFSIRGIANRFLKGLPVSSVEHFAPKSDKPAKSSSSSLISSSTSLSSSSSEDGSYPVYQFPPAVVVPDDSDPFERDFPLAPVVHENSNTTVTDDVDVNTTEVNTTEVANTTDVVEDIEIVDDVDGMDDVDGNTTEIIDDMDSMDDIDGNATDVIEKTATFVDSISTDEYDDDFNEEWLENITDSNFTDFY